MPVSKLPSMMEFQFAIISSYLCKYHKLILMYAIMTIKFKTDQGIKFNHCIHTTEINFQLVVLSFLQKVLCELVIANKIYSITLVYRMLAREKQKERERPNLNTVVRGSLGAGNRCPMARKYSITSCPVDRLGQYLNSAGSHNSQFTSTSFQFSSAQHS